MMVSWAMNFPAALKLVSAGATQRWSKCFICTFRVMDWSEKNEIGQEVWVDTEVPSAGLGLTRILP